MKVYCLDRMWKMYLDNLGTVTKTAEAAGNRDNEGVKEAMILTFPSLPPQPRRHSPLPELSIPSTIIEKRFPTPSLPPPLQRPVTPISTRHTCWPLRKYGTVMVPKCLAAKDPQNPHYSLTLMQYPGRAARGTRPQHSFISVQPFVFDLFYNDASSFKWMQSAQSPRGDGWENTGFHYGLCCRCLLTLQGEDGTLKYITSHPVLLRVGE